MRPVVVPLSLAPLVLAACQQPTPSGEPAGTDVAGAMQPGTPSPDPITAPPSARQMVTAIPERFRGVWDYTQGNCNPASDLRMDIGADRIEFYESLGTVTGVMLESPDSIVVNLAMEGEGERWTVRNRLALSANGRTLTPSDIEADSEQPMPRKRCRAGGDSR